MVWRGSIPAVPAREPRAVEMFCCPVCREGVILAPPQPSHDIDLSRRAVLHDERCQRAFAEVLR